MYTQSKTYPTKKPALQFKKGNARKWHNFLKYLTLLCSIFHIVNTSSAHKALRQCPSFAPLNDHPFLTTNAIQYPVDKETLTTLHQDYVIFANTPIEYTEYVIFSELHNSHHHKALQQKYIPRLSNKKNYLLLEGIEHFTPASCPSHILSGITLGKNISCLGWNHPALSLNPVVEQLIAIVHKYNPLLSKTLVSNPQKMLTKWRKLLPLNEFSLPDIHFGIVNDAEMLSMEKLQNHPDALYKLTKDIIAGRIVNIIKHINPRQETLDHYGEVFCQKEISDLVTEVKSVFRNTNTVSKIKARNNYLIKTASNLQSKADNQDCTRKFVIGGANHFYDAPEPTHLWSDKGKERYDYKKAKSEHDKRRLFFFKMANWNNEDPFFELREHLAQTRYAILYPVKG